MPLVLVRFWYGSGTIPGHRYRTALTLARNTRRFPRITGSLKFGNYCQTTTMMMRSGAIHMKTRLRSQNNGNAIYIRAQFLTLPHFLTPMTVSDELVSAVNNFFGQM